tara:strand:+ start:83 stop:571 length:489 start_codon:yes stop_codon:yes gene_type:complete
MKNKVAIKKLLEMQKSISELESISYQSKDRKGDVSVSVSMPYDLLHLVVQDLCGLYMEEQIWWVWCGRILHPEDGMEMSTYPTQEEIDNVKSYDWIKTIDDFIKFLENQIAWQSDNSDFIESQKKLDLVEKIKEEKRIKDGQLWLKEHMDRIKPSERSKNAK